jgi:hypothetical protein
MIVSSSRDIPTIDGLILIDCWEPQVESKKFLQQFYINLLNQLSKFKFCSIVNASTSCRLDINDPSQHNTIQQYAWQNRYNISCRTAEDNNIIANLVSFSSTDEQTSVILNRSLLDNNHSFSIFTIDDFRYHCQHHLNNQFKNWLVVGQTWQMCTHENSIGLRSLRRLIYENFNFYTIDSGFCKIDGELVHHSDYATDKLQYELIYDFGYRLLRF